MSEAFWVEKWWELGETGVTLNRASPNEAPEWVQDAVAAWGLAEAHVRVEDKARHLLAHQYAVKFGAQRAVKVLQGPWTMEEDAALRAISAALAQQPATVEDLNAWRAAFVAERATRYREGGMAIEQARIHAETDAERMALAAGQQPAVVDDQDVDACPQCGGGVITIHHKFCREDECDWFKDYTTGRGPRLRG